MKKTILSLIVLAATFLGAYPVLAEINGGEFSISPFVGGFFYDSSQNIEPSIALGARLGYNLDRNWGVEGSLTYARPRFNGYNGYLVNVRGDVIYHFFPQKKLIPFLALGGGWMSTEAGDYASDNATLDVGAGVKYFLNDSVALRGDFRQVMSLGPQTKDGTDCLQNSEFTVGLTFQFGGPKPVSPAVEPVAAPVQEPARVEVAPPVEETPSCWMADTTETPSGKILVTGLCFKDNALEIIASERIRKYDVFTLSQPSRLVIDISNAASGFKAKFIQANRLGIARVRFESYPDYLRMFLDAEQGLILPYRVEETDGSLKIIITPSNIPSPDKVAPDTAVPDKAQ
jgi:outer membrane beta-barrel protein